ncbi:MAG: hypothetical protein R8J94_18015 [Acidimicrobiia bacterium]|nr:hypothetical protein [Acidimicrobiia bacterium]
MSDVPGFSVGLVVGAGGPTGGPFIHAALGAIERLSGWTAPAAKTIVGTSAGAFVAASIDPAPQMTTSDHLSAFAQLDNGESYAMGTRHRFVARVRLAGGALLARVSPTARPVAEYTVPSSPYHRAASVVSVERRTARRVSHALHAIEDAEAAVRASAAIPGLNAPIEVDGALHVDGAVHSAANADLIDFDTHDAIIVIAPMVAGSGGSLVARSHRAQLRSELDPWVRSDKPAIIVTPNDVEHADRRDRQTFERAGAEAVRRLTIGRDV